MKRILVLILIAIMLLSLVGCKGNQYEGGNKNIEYVEIDIEKVNDDIESNRAKAKEEYIGKYVSIKCTVSSVNSKDSFKVIERGNPLGVSLHPVTCSVKDKDLQEIVLNLKKGQKIEIKGKITQIDQYFYGFDVQVYEINR
jgi:hypothetical protein